MKKGFLTVVLFIICVLACMFSLAACGGNDPSDKTDTDKAKQNTEFVEYRKAVVSILNDNGIFVNDYDNVTGTAKNQKRTYNSFALVSSRKEDNNSIKNLLEKPENLQNSEDYTFAQKQIYAISLRLSLCVGDGITTYFGEKNFYGITVKMNDTYYKVKKADNDTYTVQGYTLQEIDGSTYELFDHITLRYTSVNDYDFTFVEWNDQSSYFGYGNSDKELLLVSEADVIYSPDSAMFYATQDSEIVSQCAEQVKYAKPTDFAPYIALKDEVRYTINDKQFNALFDKYFKDVQSSIAPQEKGVQTEDINGKKVATAYIADGEDKAVITSDIEYIREQFVIEDNDGTVKSLYIPSSVKYVVNNDGNIINLDDPDKILRIEHRVGNMGGESPLDFVEVQNGSPLFKVGSGHLYSKSGRLLYVADIAMQELDCDILSFYDLNFSEYKNLLKNFKASNSLSVNLEEFEGKENVDLNLQKLFKLLKLSKLNIEGNGRLGIEELPVTRDMTINIRNLGEEGYVGINMVNSSSTKYNVTVNITGFDKSQFISVVPKQPEKTADDWEMTFVPNNKIFTTVNVDMDATYFNMFCKDRIETDKANSKIVLQPSAESAPNGFYINDINEDMKSITLRLNEDVSDGTYTVPNTLLGYKVDRVMLYLNSFENKSVKITVNKEILIWFVITESGVEFFNENFVIKSDGTFDELKEKMIGFSDYENTDIVFTAECSDKTDLMKLGMKYSDDNPDNFAYKTTVVFKGTPQKIPVREGEDLYDVNLVQYFNIDATKVYYILGGETAQCLTFEDYGEGNTGLWIRVPRDRDSEYTLIEIQSGTRDYRLTDEKENYDLSLTARFSSENIEGDNIVITSGTVFGRPIFMPDNGGEKDIPTDIPDEQRFDFLQGVRCELFSEFDLPLGDDENNISLIRVKITLDENGGLKLVYCEQIVIYEVNITLCDGSQLHQNLLWGEKIDFDCETWKIESGYTYYYECSNGNGSWRNYLDTGCGYLDIPADNYNITLHKVIADQEKSFDLTGDGYTVTGKANVYYSADNRLYYIQITPDNTTINGQTVTAYQNIADFYETKMQITRFTAADFSYVTSDEETIHITETFMLCVFWEFDNDGNLTVTSAELKSNTVIGYSHSSTSSNSISWNVNITDNSAEIVYSVDGDIVAVNECNLSGLSDGDRNKP